MKDSTQSASALGDRPRDRLRHFGLVGLVMVWLGGCVPPSSGPDASTGDAFNPPPGCPQTTETLQAALLAPHCGASGCHGATNPSNGLDLVSAGLAARVANVPARGCPGEILAVPGDPTNSFLIHKLTDDMPTCGARMPLGAAPLSETEVSCLESWVASLPAPSGDAGVDAGLDTGPDASSPDGGSDAATCPSGQTLCGAACVDTTTSVSNCGACGQACGAGQSCASGACACGGGLALCGGLCADTQADAANCGSCGHACGTGFVCSAGACVRGSCPTGTVDCGGSCVDTQASVLDCGSCGHACLAGQACNTGSCDCLSGTTLCGTSCVNAQTDNANCGSCGHACASGTSCTGGTCTVTCAAGTTLCGTSCANLQSDNANCGSCGHACGAGATCTGGACAGCGASVSFATQVQPIFTANCTTGCHGGVHPSQGMSLAAGQAYSNLVNVPASSCTSGRLRVTPGNVSASYLINKLTGVGMCSGSQMPVSGGPLPTATVDLIRAWICEGAPNN